MTFFWLWVILQTEAPQTVITSEVEGFLLFGREAGVFSASLDPFTFGIWADFGEDLPSDRRIELQDSMIQLDYKGYHKAVWFRAKATTSTGGTYGHCCGEIKYRSQVEILEILEFSAEPVHAFLKKHPEYVPPPDWNPPPD